MLSIFITVLPVFLIIAAGYAAMWQKLLSNDAVDALAKFAQKFAIPCLLFLAVAQLDLETYFNIPLFATYYLPRRIHIHHRRPHGIPDVSTHPWPSCRRWLHHFVFQHGSLGPPHHGTRIWHASTFHQLCLGVGSCVVLLYNRHHMYGRFYVQAVMALSQSSRQSQTPFSTTHWHWPLIMGFAFNFSGIAMPTTLEAALEMMARSALPVALFALGGVLHRYKLTSNLPEVAMVWFGKTDPVPDICLHHGHSRFRTTHECAEFLCSDCGNATGHQHLYLRQHV